MYKVELSRYAIIGNSLVRLDVLHEESMYHYEWLTVSRRMAGKCFLFPARMIGSLRFDNTGC